MSSLLNKYFFNFSYIGTKFNGVAKQANSEVTVHNVIYKYVESLNDICNLKSKICISSRTDAGVHSLSNSGHFQLEFKEEFLRKKLNIDNLNATTNQKLVCDYLKNKLNDLFIENDFLIRILNIQKVNPEFSARNAKSRTYIYRLGLLENSSYYWNELVRINKVEDRLNNNKKERFDYLRINSIFPLHKYATSIEKDLITELKEPFDKDLFLKAISLFNGKHDFSAFTSNFGRKEMLEYNKNPVKTVKIGLKNETKQVLDDFIHQFDQKYKVMEVEITAESFLYKMIRKMLGTATDVANGKLPLEKIELMLKTPQDYYDLDTTVLKPNGLFLKNVEYDPSLFN